MMADIRLAQSAEPTREIQIDKLMRSQRTELRTSVSETLYKSKEIASSIGLGMNDKHLSALRAPLVEHLFSKEKVLSSSLSESTPFCPFSRCSPFWDLTQAEVWLLSAGR